MQLLGMDEKKMNECKNCKYLATFLEDVKEKKNHKSKTYHSPFPTYKHCKSRC